MLQTKFQAVLENMIFANGGWTDDGRRIYWILKAFGSGELKYSCIYHTCT